MRITSFVAPVALALALGATGIATAAGDTQVGPLAGAVHATLILQLKDGSSQQKTLDRGRVTAVADGSFSLTRADKSTATFQSGVAVKVGDRVGLVSDGSGNVVQIRFRHGKGAPKEHGLHLFKGVVHGTGAVTKKDGTSTAFTYDRGRILSLAGGALVVKRADGVSVSLSVDSATVVRDKGTTESADALTVGERAMFFSNGGHVFLVRCLSKAKAQAGTGSL